MKQKSNANILLVDDNLSNLLALKAVLDLPKYNLYEADSGPKAIQLSREIEFALIILDIQMPVMDGFETAKHIKETMNKDTPLIFVTAVYRDDPFVKKGFEAGAIDYFGKPFDPDILKAKASMYTDLYMRTKRLAETEKLLATQAQLKTLLEALPIGVVIAAPEGDIYEFNDEAEKIWGSDSSLPLEKAIHRKGWFSTTNKEIKSGDWALNRALRKEESVHEDLIEIEDATGIRKRVLNSAYPIRGKTGQLLGAVVTFQDVSIRQEIALHLEEKIKDLLKDARQLQKETTAI